MSATKCATCPHRFDPDVQTGRWAAWKWDRYDGHGLCCPACQRRMRDQPATATTTC